MIDYSIKTVDKLDTYLDSINVNHNLKTEILEGTLRNSMSVSITNHVLNLIDWSNPISDPIRKQFLPLRSEYLPSHPQSQIDSLSEKNRQVSSGLIHRYPNKVLFLLTNSCPTYCAFCTRSYTVGPNTKLVDKSKLTQSVKSRIRNLIDYIRENKNINDIVISGGDIACVNPSILDITLKEIQNIKTLKTVRLATRTLLFYPDIFIPETQLFEIIVKYAESFKNKGIELSIQCHFNHANEISIKSQHAATCLASFGVKIRNQTVLLDGINSNHNSQKELIDKLILSSIEPYYVYQMDMVANTEHFRTNLKTCIDISKSLTGLFPGFHLPRFIVDLPYGGGKRSVYEYESHDDKYGIYWFISPAISQEKKFSYCDPLRYLDPDIQEEWLTKKTISAIYGLD
jgi:lysine 2,3-aminomutase